jgi:hypothetical protein
VDGNQVRFLLAQVGPKRGSRIALERLLPAGELPGAGWTVIDQRTWRTGVGGRSSWQASARAVGSITAWRSFEQADAHRYLWIQVTPLAGPSDAGQALADLVERSLANPRFVGAVGERRTVRLSLQAGAGMGVEQDVITGSGASTTLTLPLVTGATVAIVCASGSGSGGWQWPEVVALAEAQSARLAAAPGSSAP